MKKVNLTEEFSINMEISDKKDQESRGLFIDFEL